MTWKIKVSTPSEKYYKKLDKKLREKIKSNLLDLSVLENPMAHPQIKPLTGDSKGFYRLRIGDYRVIISLLEDIHIISVVNIVHRGSWK